MKVLVGLGNPGAEYSGTRHNVGFDVVDYLAAAPTVAPFKTRFDAHVAEAREGSEVLLLVKPQTYMNLSGKTVRQIFDFYKLNIPDLLVVCDDFNLPLGKLRIRAGGTPGGQNGLRNIGLVLGTDEYPRLRIGVGSPEFGKAVDHVLGRFKAVEKPVIEPAIATAAQAVITWALQGLPACMNKYNGSAEERKPKKDKPVRKPPEKVPPPDENTKV